MYKHKFFKKYNRALQFANTVEGEVHHRFNLIYDVALSHIKYPEGIKEEFEWVVMWEEKDES